MNRQIPLIALLVRDYDEAIRYYCSTLGFTLQKDELLEAEGKRWVVVSPGDNAGANLLLAEASTEEQRARVGDQTGGRVFLFLHTDNFQRDHASFSARGVTFLEAPRQEAYGTVAVFRDLYGNLWDLLEPTE